ncbi:MAG: hypothetical protein R2799_14285 [Crocinitomicaceae bacterium]
MIENSLNPEQLETVKIYLRKLAELRGEECLLLSSWTDEDLSILTGSYKLIQKFGEGDPVKAAIKHQSILDGVKEAIKLSSSDKSTAVH